MCSDAISNKYTCMSNGGGGDRGSNEMEPRSGGDEKRFKAAIVRPVCGKCRRIVVNVN